MSDWIHPCITCGACCAHYRVSLHWREAEDAGGSVPTELTEDWNSMVRVMKGTLRRPSRCLALAGTVGESVSCRIYEQRPTTCRDLKASWEDGTRDEQCDRARVAYGMQPLSPADFADKPKA